ncbi:EAL domain-containing protein [Paraburkholderia rhizosphaerae]|uniref:EAL domain-containing protein (Putative c-di-GMP-specific phosphodiesterase class I) n=1 Tax=Paraburkholderia rhizosphaerae TaxID=480658 RepID=A0A4R8LUT4_9BURK|nr:EAL domain-containing protein [Paraburkholderia rhizosphaerae]TDY51553.1 EAL domain-containing protein (putative c-di-GMP-specific phosphodiesterase class I) [Paraburkholderia rhizosphaerae]
MSAQAAHAAAAVALTQSASTAATDLADGTFSGRDCAGPAVVRLPAPLGGMGMDQALNVDTRVACRFTHVASKSESGERTSTSTSNDSAAQQAATVIVASDASAALSQNASSSSGMIGASFVQPSATRLATTPADDTQPITQPVSHDTESAGPAIPWQMLIRVGVAILLGAALLGAIIAGLMLARARWFSPRATLARAARRGLRRNEFHLEYQPVFFTRTQKCVGLEVMLRWRNSVHGIRGAEWYMEQLDRSPIAERILNYVFETAATELEGLNQSESLYLIVDVPASMLESSDSIAKLVKMADRLAQASHVVLQLPVDDVAGVMSAIAKVRNDKIRIGVSHVRSASHKLESLAQAGCEFVKVDRDVMGLEEGARAHQLQELASAGRRLNMAVVVDGVEGVSQFHAVGRAHIDLAQGFYLGKAITAARFATFFDDQMRHRKEDLPPRFMHAFHSH